MNGLLPHSGNFQPGDHVSLIKDPTRRGLIVDVVSTWRSVRWSGRGTSNHRPGELVPAMLTETELAKARSPVEAAALLQQMLDEEILLTADDGVRVANSFPRADGTPGRQLTALRDAGGEWRVRCEVCDIPNILAPGKLREPDADPRDIASQAKRHVGAWKSLLGHRPVREHWRRLAQVTGLSLPMPQAPEPKPRRADVNYIPWAKKPKREHKRTLYELPGHAAAAAPAAAPAPAVYAPDFPAPEPVSPAARAEDGGGAPLSPDAGADGAPPGAAPSGGLRARTWAQCRKCGGAPRPVVVGACADPTHYLCEHHLAGALGLGSVSVLRAQGAVWNPNRFKIPST